MARYRSKFTGEIIDVPDGPQMPANPTFPYEGPQAAANLNKTQQEIVNDAERIALERQRVQIAQQAAAQAAAARQTAQQVSERERNSRLGTLNALRNQIDKVDQLYRAGPGATKGVAGVMDYLPTPGNRAFDSAGAGLAEIGLNAFRTPGVGSQSDKELKAFVEANRPSASDYDEQIQQKLWNLRNRLSEAYKPYGVNYPAARGPTRNAPRKPPSGGWKIERLD